MILLCLVCSLPHNIHNATSVGLFCSKLKLYGLSSFLIIFFLITLLLVSYCTFIVLSCVHFLLFLVFFPPFFTYYNPHCSLKVSYDRI